MVTLDGALSSGKVHPIALPEQSIIWFCPGVREAAARCRTEHRWINGFYPYIGENSVHRDGMKTVIIPASGVA
jgi:hypothetical protein